MIDIKKLQLYYDEDMVFVTAHAAERFRQRGIKKRILDMLFKMERLLSNILRIIRIQVVCYWDLPSNLSHCMWL